MNIRSVRRSLVAASTIVAVSGFLALPTPGETFQAATPPAASCDAVPCVAATPSARDGAMDGMQMEMDVNVMYIDMMIPHHASIIAMSEAALTRLEDERLREIAETVVATQQSEIEELRSLREQLTGEPDPMPMGEPMMNAMEEMMPGMSGTMDEMAFQMDAEAQVAAICGAEDADLAFIDLAIPHHQMAIESSEAVLAQEGTVPEIRDIAQRVIDAQVGEIETLAEIRQELYGSATPEPVAP